MDGGMGMGGDDSSSGPLTPAGVDFSNETDAFNFLQEILDDTDLQVDGNNAARNFWYGIVVVIAIAGICNVIWQWTLHSRLRASNAKHPHPSRPTSFFAKWWATLTALTRESTYLQGTPSRYSFWIIIPPFGKIYLIVAYLAFIIALEFIYNDVAGAQYYQALSVRAAWLAISQVPLLVLLAGKNSLIGLISGVSYERLNVYHRWVARGLLLMATFHFGFESYGWAQYGLMQLEWSTDTCPPTGIAAYSLVLWMNLTTLAPFRNLSYDFFVAQHIITFFGFIIAIMLHIPTTAPYARTYIYIPIALYLVERLIRTARYAWNNVRPAKAVSLEPLVGEATKIRVSSRQVKRWTPGGHVLLSIPRYDYMQSHPATIISTPTSHGGDLVFILRAYGGFTRRLWKAACKKSDAISIDDVEKKGAEQDASRSGTALLALIDGPYGAPHADFACFDTVFLIAGGSGITYTLAVLLNLAERATSSSTLPVQRIHFSWVIKSRSWMSWIKEELQVALSRLSDAGLEVDVQIFVTCDDSMIDDTADTEMRPKAAGGCQCQENCRCCETSPESADDVDPDAIEEDKVASSLEPNSPSAQQKGGAVVSGDVKTGGCGKRIDVSGSSSDAGSIGGTPTVFNRGRPNFDSLLWKPLSQAEGESAIVVCGPLGLTTKLRQTVVRISDERAVHKGTGAQGIYMHVESFH